MSSLWAEGRPLVQPPMPGLIWIMDGKALSKRRNQAALRVLLDDVAASKSAPDRREIARTYWRPFVYDALIPNLPEDRIPAAKDVIPVSATQGAFLAIAARATSATPVDRLSHAVGAFVYNKMRSSFDDVPSNVFVSWGFALGYWVYHQPDATEALGRAAEYLQQLQSNMALLLERLSSEGFSKAMTGSEV